MSEQANLDEIAVRELLNEAKRGAARASVQGALGWQKCPLAPTNKRFLNNMLVNTLHANRIKRENERKVRMKEIHKRSRSPKTICKSSASDLRNSKVNLKNGHDGGEGGNQDPSTDINGGDESDSPQKKSRSKVSYSGGERKHYSDANERLKNGNLINNCPT